MDRSFSGTRFLAGERVPFSTTTADVLPEGAQLEHFPGQHDLRGDLTVAEILARSAIARVEALGAPIDERSVVVTGGFVRPRVLGGAIVLHVTPLADGRFQPFDVERPHRCCELDEL